MKTHHRPRLLERLLEKEFSVRERREIQMDPAVDGFGAKGILRAIKRSGKAGIVDMGPGQFEGFSVDRHVEVLSREPGLTEIRGTITASYGPSLLRGLTIRPEGARPALTVHSGIVVCDDCEILGAIAVAPGASVYLRNSLVDSPENGLVLGEGAAAEIAGSRIIGRPAGISFSKGAECALYHCRVEKCVGSHDGDNGTGVLGLEGRLYAEGTEFFDNQIGTYLQDPASADFLGCHWKNNRISSLIVRGSKPEAVVLAGSCVFQGPLDCPYPSVALEGGHAKFDRCRIASPAGTSCTAVDLKLDFSRLESEAAPALDMAGGKLNGTHNAFVSEGGPALQLERTSGSISESTLHGTVAVASQSSYSVAFSDIKDSQPVPGVNGVHADHTDLNLEYITSSLSGLIGQPAVKSEMERLLRLAFAARERKRNGFSIEHQIFSGVLTGPALSGQSEAIRIFIDALYRMGEVAAPDVLEVSLSETSIDHLNAQDFGGVIVFLDDPSQMAAATADSLLRLVRAAAGTTHVFLSGDRESLQSLLRTRFDLARELPVELRFEAFGPSDLATLFADHCMRENIPIGLEAAKKIPVIFHGLHDRLQKRFLNVEGVMQLFAETRRNYLDRCSRAGNFHLELEPQDIVVPLDRSILITLSRSAELVAVCPSCKGQTPWLPGLVPDFHCRHCHTDFVAEWGLLRNSTFLRKKHLSDRSFRTGAVALRRTVASAVRS